VEEMSLAERMVEAVKSRWRDDRGLSSPALRVVGVDGARIELELRFRAGERYCCGEPGCYLGADRVWWKNVRRYLGEDAPGGSVVLWVRGVVEDGALFVNLGSLGLPERSGAYEYEHQVREADGV
jgi:hypothetical protein